MNQGLKLTLLTSPLATGATLGMTNAIARQAGDLILRADECPTQVSRYRHRSENPDDSRQL